MLSSFTTSFATVVAPVTDPARVATSRARTAPVRHRRPARTVQLLGGLTLVGTGVATVITAGLGVASWDVLHVGLSGQLGWSIGAVAALLSVAAAGLAALLGERARLGALVPVAVVGPTIDLVHPLLDTPDALVGQVAMLAAGMVTLAVGVGAYVASDHGAGPGDLVFLSIARRGVPLWLARSAVDGTLVLVGWLAGGPVGLGTLLLTLGLGPLIGTTIRVFDLAPAREETGRRDAAFHRRVARELHEELEGV
jgi:uncharacterized membrane protein YczE